MNKRLQTGAATICLAALGIASSLTASANDRDGHRHRHHHQQQHHQQHHPQHHQPHHGRASVTFQFGGPAYAPAYRPAPRSYYYSPPVVYAPPVVYSSRPAVVYAPPVVYARPVAPPVYVERSDVPAAVSYWYFCREADAYYPYVQDCPSAWEPVVPRPPSAGR